VGVILFVFIITVGATGIIEIVISSAGWTPNLRNPVFTDTHNGSVRIRRKFLELEFSGFLLLGNAGKIELQFSALGTAVDLHLKAALHTEIDVSHPRAHIALLKLFLH